MAKDSVVRPERLELPTYWFEAMNETAINNLDELGWSDAVQSYQSVSLKSVALRITPSVQVVGIPAGLEENRSTSH